jgi:hypothetical protein
MRIEDQYEVKFFYKVIKCFHQDKNVALTPSKFPFNRVACYYTKLCITKKKMQLRV